MLLMLSCCACTVRVCRVKLEKEVRAGEAEKE